MRAAFLFIILFVSGSLSMNAQAQSDTQRLYVGTYSVRGSEGIYTVAFDRKTGQLTQTGSTNNGKSPSFLALHPSKPFLYAVNESADGTNGLNVYAIEATTGTLTLLNQGPSEGAGPCHVSVDGAGRLVFVSTYGGGTFAALSVGNDGKLGATTFRQKFDGNNPGHPRQDAPHAHSATLSPDSRFVYVADLGNDRVYGYAVDAGNQQITPAATPFVTVQAGSGPRHMAFSKDGRFAYLAEELVSSVAVFSRNPKTGTLTLIQDRVGTLPANFSGSNTSADIHIDPSGKYLYQSNRGLNALSVLRINKGGNLTLLGNVPTGGKTPRNFWIDPQGGFIIVANQESDNLVVFRRDVTTGMFAPTGQELRIPSPVCVISSN
jgi:6-phosphogluconolactonase